MWKFLLSDICGKPLHIHNADLSHHKPVPVLVITDLPKAHGVFKAVNGTVAATTVIVTPPIDGAIVVTDILISAERKNAGTVTLQITDGVNTEILFTAAVTNDQVALAVSINGNMRGWKNARLEVVTVEDFIYSVTAGYYKITEGASFLEWDAER